VRYPFAQTYLPAVALLTLLTSGCTFGPRLLESSHGPYNHAVKQVTEEELLLNLVRLRYNDDPVHLDVSSIAAQYELDASAEARPFLGFASSLGLGFFKSTVLPDAAASASNRPTLTMVPLDDPDNVRRLFRPGTAEEIAFLAETSWPIATIFRLYVETLNRVPNAPSASGPTRPIVPEFREFQRAVWLLQTLEDRGGARFVHEEKLTEVGSPLSADRITADAQVQAAKNGYEYRERPDKTWALVKRDRRLVLKINPTDAGSPEVQELCALLNLHPGLLSYAVAVGSDDPFSLTSPPPPTDTLRLVVRSTVQAMFYLAHGVLVPPEHVACGLVQVTVEPDGQVFDWQEVTRELFTVRSVKQHCRPEHAHVAVRYRGWWFYIDDRDQASKTTFSLLMPLARVDLVGARKATPVLTLPISK
jgi:hypothetical protein